MHQEHPSAFLKTVSSYVKDGGILAFHEIDMRTTFDILPNVLAYLAVCDEIMQAIAAGTPHPDTAAKRPFFGKPSCPSRSSSAKDRLELQRR
ncbi:hypothetical protein [Rhizobium sp. WYJ-E13]|uniref:hypothetical protein n=1 Tax=Rhizobium sp. WYJ-E13 TaxID=2849093 RepID=UPI001C1ED088|nr:hypothetical protein [Rhizobium sp. WYJ-E13]QWW72449.1 hypothetical protein KQ933_31480 [Rhizobium sp. WYJ-E13]